MNWIQRNFKQIIYVSFLFPILLVAFVSISHVTKWYGIGNPLSWAIYLSVAVEIAALSSLAAIVGKMGKNVYFPFILVTLIQFIGNIFYSYQYIKIDNQVFLDWVELVNPVFSFWVEPTDLLAHKRIVSFLLGGLLPIISLTFLGLLVKFEETDWKNEDTPKAEPEPPKVDASDVIGEISRVRLSQDELDNLEKVVQKVKPLTSKDEIPVGETETQGRVGIEEQPPFGGIPGEIPYIDYRFTQDVVLPSSVSDSTPDIETIPPPEIEDEPHIPALGDDEVNEMVLNDWEKVDMMPEDEYDLLADEETTSILDSVVEKPSEIEIVEHIEPGEPLIEELPPPTPIPVEEVKKK